MKKTISEKGQVFSICHISNASMWSMMNEYILYTLFIWKARGDNHNKENNVHNKKPN